MKQKKPVLMMIVKLIEIDCTDKEKELFNYGLERYQNYSILQLKLDQLHEQKGFGELIIQESLGKLDQRIEERKQKKD